MSNQIKILYSIINPDTEEVMYIGQTNNLKRRTLEHYRGSQDVDIWMRTLKKNGKEPRINVISRHHKGINTHERISIIRAKKKNENLLNRLIPVYA